MAGALLGTPGPGITPAPDKVALPTNYITDFSFIDQNLPDLYDTEFRRYGDRSVNSLLRFAGAEMPTNSDLIKWGENGRLHTQYRDCTTASADAADTSVFTVGGGSCNFRVNQTVLLSDNATGAQAKGIVSATTTATFTVEYYKAAGQPTGFNASAAITAFVYGSEFKKGSAGMVGSLDPNSEFFDNKTVIIKDNYEVSGSDMAQVTWLKGSTEEGEQGYYWFLKAKSETRVRFEDYMEMMAIEAEEAEDGSGAEVFLSDNTGGGNAGSEGLFEAVDNGGNVWSGGYPTNLSEFDDGIIDRLDKQGAISENIIFLKRKFGLAIDDMLAAQNSHGVGGTSYGLFDNSEDMALNLGFDGFKRAGYEFYKSDWKYLNHNTLRGGLASGGRNGILVPAGSMSVYDQIMGEKSTVPFLHTKYRESEHTSRKYKTWITGGEAGTDDIDEMKCNFLTERALCVMGRNNFINFED